MPRKDVDVPAPANIDAEQVVLGSVMLDPGAMENLTGWLQSSHFYDSRHAVIYAVLEKMYQNGDALDIVTVTDHLEVAGKIEAAGGAAYIMELANAVPTAIHAESYGKIVERCASDRVAIDIANAIVREAYSGSGKAIDIALQLAEDARNKTARSNDGPRFLDDVIADVVDNAQAMADLRKSGEFVDVLTPWKDLNDIIGGLLKGDQVVIVGAANVGKSAFVQQIVDFAALTGNHGAVVFTTETSAEAFAARQLAPHSGLWSRDILSGNLKSREGNGDDDWDKLYNAIPKVLRPSVLIDSDTIDIGHVDLRIRQAKARLAEKGLKLRLAVFDYLQMFRYDSVKTDSSEQLLKMAIYYIRHLAIKHQIATLVISEVTSASVRNNEVNLADAKGSGSIVYAATRGLTMQRNDDGLVVVKVQKMKDGRRGEVVLPAMASGAAWFGKPLELGKE